MAEPSANYRDKYFDALKEQERLEKQLLLQAEWLKKILLNLGSVSAGMDAQLDAAVLHLKDTIRSGSGNKIAELLDLIQHAVTDFERTRGEECLKASRAFTVLLDDYLDLRLPKSLKKSLLSFSKSLPQRLASYRQYPVVLDELYKLQLLALSHASDPQPGLWQRLRGGKALSLARPAVEQGEVVPQTEPPVIQESAAAPLRSGLAEDGEDSYSQVATRISTTLSNLVDRIEPNAIIKHRIDIVRHRLERGMDWYVLAVTLEDIRDILFLRYLQVDEEFSHYLQQLRNELGSIRDLLSRSVQSNEQQQRDIGVFSDSVASGVDRIRKSVGASEDVGALKNEVTEHVNFIAEALKHYRDQNSDRIGEQLQQLAAQIKAIEQESKVTREALEEQRHKATHDALTGLPNREAYAERAHHEIQRLQRYGHPLTLAVCDIDRFKSINDNYGHQAGDKVLKLMAKVISTRLRNVDFVARFGGEEFVILMPETNAEQAFKVLDKVRATVGKTAFRFKDAPVSITISLGIAEVAADDTVEHVFARADKALYAAKNGGRNRCELAK